MNLPVDFEQKVKLPPAVNGRSYPYQISARDLMADFRYAALQVDQDTEVSGISLVETVEVDGTRTVKLGGQSTASGGGEYHMWKVTKVSDGVWYCPGGDVFDVSNGQIYSVNSKEFTGELGYIVLKISRDSETREITEGIIYLGSSPSPLPDSNETDQYRLIAYVSMAMPEAYQITQVQFEEIRLNEELVIVNGEFRLQVYEMSHRNNYAPPA